MENAFLFVRCELAKSDRTGETGSGDKVPGWVSIRMHGSSPLLEKLAVAECIYNLSAMAEAGGSLRLLAVSLANKGSEKACLETTIPPPTKRQKRDRGRNLMWMSDCHMHRHLHT